MYEVWGVFWGAVYPDTSVTENRFIVKTEAVAIRPQVPPTALKRPRPPIMPQPEPTAYALERYAHKN